MVEPTQTWYWKGRKFHCTESEFKAIKSRDRIDVWDDADRRLELWRHNRPNEPYPTTPPKWAAAALKDGSLLHVTGITVVEAAGRLRRLQVMMHLHRTSTAPWYVKRPPQGTGEASRALAVRPQEEKPRRLARAWRRIVRVFFALTEPRRSPIFNWMMSVPHLRWFLGGHQAKQEE
jgi:hypothetical protein